MVFAVGLVLAHGSAIAQTPEYAVKAAYIYNFARFVEWPQPTRSVLRICTYGKSPIDRFLEDAVRGKLVHGVPIEIAQLPEGQTSFENCDLLFVGAAPRAKTQAILRKVKGFSILTVGECDDFAEAGGMIALFVENDRVRFKINLPAAAEAHLQISSRLAELGQAARSTR